MSSSYAIRQKQLLHENEFKIKGTVYGDVYIRPWGECHPDFVKVPINKPSGPCVCIRKPEKKRAPPSDDGANVDGAGNMYTLKKDFVIDRTRNLPREMYEKMPGQEQLVKDGYLRWEKRQNQLGIPNKLWYNNGYSVSQDFMKSKTYLDSTKPTQTNRPYA